MERQCGIFQRMLHLPEDADPDDITASSKDGVLHIVIPRKEPQEAPTRLIEIE